MNITLKYTKLGRSKAWGFAHQDLNLIEIDTRLKGRKHLEILTHETLHLLFPELDEDKIVEKSIILTKILWDENYRRVDNDTTQKLQDGKI